MSVVFDDSPRATGVSSTPPRMTRRRSIISSNPPPPPLKLKWMTPSTKTSSSRRAIAVGTVMATLGAGIFLHLWSSTSHRHFSLPQLEVMRAFGGGGEGLGYCKTLAEMAIGEWVPREPPFTDRAQVLSHIDLVQPLNAACFAPEAELDQRYLNVSSWSWQPNSCALKTFDAKAFLRFLLNSPAGLVIVGDSLSAAHFIAVWSSIALQVPYLLHHRTLLSEPAPGGGATSLHRGLFLNASHPIVNEIWDGDPGDLDIRVGRPLIQLLNSPHLIRHDDLRDIFGQDTRPNPEIYPCKTGPVVMDILGKAVEGSQTFTSKLKFPTLLVVGSGPHWSPAHLLNSKLDDMPAGYMMMVRRFVRNIRLFSTPATIDIFYRSNVPAVNSCLERSPRPASLGIELGTKFPNWQLFPTFDTHWKDAGADVEVIDVWNMVGQRPDGRRNPQIGDCLHVCMPISKVWTDVLWTRLSHKYGL